MLGRFLFRWRGAIGFVAFGFVFWLARPTGGSCLVGLPFLVLGLLVRFWASGYIGIEGRVREIGGRREGRSEKLEAGGGRAERRDRINQNSETRNQRAELQRAVDGRREQGGTPRKRIVTGPYRTLRHPLYIGNFVLVVGMLVALRPAMWLAVVVVVGFIGEYTAIAVAEERCLASSRSQKSEGRSQDAEVQIRILPPRHQDTKRIPIVQSPESFLLSRALVEWRTWVVTDVAWGLALLKAFITR